MRGNMTFVAIVLLMLLVAAPLAESTTGQGTTTKETHEKSRTLTGCLQKNAEGNGFYLVSDEGGTWVLNGKAAKLSPNVGHTVKVTGAVAFPNKGNRPQREVSITDLQLVSQGCQIDQPVQQ